MNYHILNALRVPRPGEGNDLRARVVELAARLAAVDERYAAWASKVGVEVTFDSENENERERERERERVHELDAVVSHLYDLDREHVQVIFETFHDGWDPTDRLKAVLDHYDQWEARLDG
jgi:hypothetical protein